MLIRDIERMTLENVLQLPENYYNIKYEDEVELREHKRHIVFNKICFNMFKLYPNTPIISSLSIVNFISKEPYNAETHIKVLERIFKHICAYNNIVTYQQKEPLLIMTMNIVNDIYNIVIQNGKKYAFTIDATDFVNVIENKEIVKIHNALKPTPESIEDTYSKLKKAILLDLDPNNNFVKAYKSKAVNENQSNQCLGPRGFVSDIDKSVYRYPILNGFIRGLNSIYEIIVESKTAAKSLFNNENSVKISEYISRRFNLLAMTVTGIEIGDCGSEEYFEFLVTSGNIKNLKGKYYLSDENKLKVINGNEEHLIDKLVKLRTTLGCKLGDHHKVCSTCFGELSHNFPINTNIGYITTAFLMEKSSQSILSTKHLTHSVKKSVIKLEGVASKYFNSDEENNIYFNPGLDLSKYAMILSSNKLNKLVDVLNTKNKNISLIKIGELDEIYMRRLDNNATENVIISYKDRNSIITRYFLDYIKKYRPETDSRGNFVVYLDKFEKENAVFHCPLKETDVVKFITTLSSMVETSTKNTNDKYTKLSLVFNHILDKFSINIAIPEILIYATTAKNPHINDYRCGRNSPEAKCVNKQQIFRNRDLAALFVFEGQMSILDELHNVDNKYRPDHPMNVLFDPYKILSN